MRTRLSYHCFYVSLSASLLIAAPRASAEHDCCENLRRPYVCELELYVSKHGHDWKRLRRRPQLEIARGKSIEIEARGVDQDGRDFPADRLLVGVDVDRSFDRHFELEELDDGSYRITAEDDRGDGQLRFWLPGNLNHDIVVDLEIGHDRKERKSRKGRLQVGSSRRAEYTCESLYLAILGRKPDAPGAALAIEKLEDDDVDGLIAGMFKSDEFNRNRRTLDTDRLLADFYRGLLKRDPDPAGQRGYAKDMQRRKYKNVIKSLLDSREYERTMMKAISK